MASAHALEPVIDPNPGLGPGPSDPPVPTEKKLSSYYGSVDLNPARPNKHMSDIVQEITQHMSTQPGAKAKISVKVEIELPNGLDESVQRTVLENSKALRLRCRALTGSCEGRERRYKPRLRALFGRDQEEHSFASA